MVALGEQRGMTRVPESQDQMKTGTPEPGGMKNLSWPLPQPSNSQGNTHVLKQGSPESRNMPMVTYW